jgi:hypothetical protein
VSEGGAAEPQVAWKAIEANATVVSSDGEEIGQVAEIAGDSTADIFDGLVVSLGMIGANRHLPAERVTAIWPTRVEVDLTRAEIEALPDYEQPQSERWQPDTGTAGFFRRLFGRGRT